jgi:hypothetical protein
MRTARTTCRLSRRPQGTERQRGDQEAPAIVGVFRADLLRVLRQLGRIGLRDVSPTQARKSRRIVGPPARAPGRTPSGRPSPCGTRCIRTGSASMFEERGSISSCASSRCDSTSRRTGRSRGRSGGCHSGGRRRPRRRPARAAPARTAFVSGQWRRLLAFEAARDRRLGHPPAQLADGDGDADPRGGGLAPARVPRGPRRRARACRRARECGAGARAVRPARARWRAPTPDSRCRNRR